MWQTKHLFGYESVIAISHATVCLALFNTQISSQTRDACPINMLIIPVFPCKLSNMITIHTSDPKLFLEFSETFSWEPIVCFNSHPVFAPHMAQLVMHYEHSSNSHWGWPSRKFCVPTLARQGFETGCNAFFIFALASIAEIPKYVDFLWSRSKQPSLQ